MEFFDGLCTLLQAMQVASIKIQRSNRLFKFQRTLYCSKFTVDYLSRNKQLFCFMLQLMCECFKISVKMNSVRFNYLMHDYMNGIHSSREYSIMQKIGWFRSIIHYSKHVNWFKISSSVFQLAHFWYSILRNCWTHLIGEVKICR